MQDAKQSLKQFSDLLGSALNDVSFTAVSEAACRENPWFTPGNINKAITTWVNSLSTDAIQRWLGDHQPPLQPKKVGLIMAGNIPLVGLHDLLATLVSNHQAYIKPASDDSVLIRWVVDLLSEANETWRERMFLVQKLNNIDALIATGSNNSSRYFEYYFKDIPHIIRKNRNSVAVLTGNESDAALAALGDDVFSYFGLGCRNVSKVFLPEGFDPRRLLAAWDVRVQELRLHNRFLNNFEYNLALLMVNRVPHFSNNALILTAAAEISSPLSVLHYEFYSSIDKLIDELNVNNNLIQCILSEDKNIKNAIPLGTSQTPALWDYADNVNTLQFLNKL